MTSKQEINVLCIGDVHITTASLPDFHIFVGQLHKHLEENKYDLIVVLGDVLHDHSRLHSACLTEACTFLTNLTNECDKVITLIGNHDLESNSNFLDTKHWMNCIKHVKNHTVVDKVCTLNLNNIHFKFVPYVPDGRLVEALNTTADWKNADCIFGHQLLDGVKMGAIIADKVEKWKDDYPMLISGHIHNKQKVQENLMYTGSCRMLAFGEANDKSLMKIVFTNINSKQPMISEIFLDLPRKVTKYKTIEDMKAFKITDVEKDPKLHIRFCVSGTQADFTSLKRGKIIEKLEALSHKVVFKPSKLEIDNQKKLINNICSDTSLKSFSDILHKLVHEEKNIDLINTYDKHKHLIQV